jgi:hypothetical protein
VFFVPTYPKAEKGGFKAQSDAVIEALIERYRGAAKDASWAWYFPRQTRFYPPELDKPFMPGVIAAFAEVKK